jgi:hypothetical protein
MVNHVRNLFLVSILALIIPLTFACGGGAGGGVKTNSTTDMTVLSISEGPVLVQRNGSQDWVDGKAGMDIKAGDRVKTEPDGTATIVFFEGSSLELKGETEIALTELTGKQDTSTTIKMKQEIGTTISRVKKLADTASRYEIETPAATAGVRGTIFKVVVLADGTTIVTNTEGSISVTAQGKTIILEEKTRVTIKRGQEPGEPEPLTTLSPTPAQTTATTLPSVIIVRLQISCEYTPTPVKKGDTISITYYIYNYGNVPLSDMVVTDDTGTVAYSQGDNGNGILDSLETWFYDSKIPTETDGPDYIDIHVTASGKSPGDPANQSVKFTVDLK